MNELSKWATSPYLAAALILITFAPVLSGCSAVLRRPPEPETPTSKPAPTRTPTPTTMPIPYEFHLFVTRENGIAIHGATVELAIAEGTFTSSQTTSKVGEVFWRNLPGAAIDLVISARGYFMREDTLTLDPGRNAIVVRLERSCPELTDISALSFPTYHVQGLAVSELIYYITSIDTQSNRAWLFTVDRATLDPIKQQDLTEGTLTHPGGIELDGTYLWIPNAEYDSDGPSKILALDPHTLQVLRSFNVGTHISLIASNGSDRLYGTDWASANFYVWDWEGNLIETVPSPTGVEYQDCQFVDPHLICGGYERPVNIGLVDVIDPLSWSLVDRIDLGKTRLGHPLTREGLSILSGELYLLPEDGPESKVMTYRLCSNP